MDHVVVIVSFTCDGGIGLQIFDIGRAVRILIGFDCPSHLVDLLLLNGLHLLVDRLKFAEFKGQLIDSIFFDSGNSNTVPSEFAVEQSDRLDRFRFVLIAYGVHSFSVVAHT